MTLISTAVSTRGKLTRWLLEGFEEATDGSCPAMEGNQGRTGTEEGWVVKIAAQNCHKFDVVLVVLICVTIGSPG